MTKPEAQVILQAAMMEIVDKGQVTIKSGTLQSRAMIICLEKNWIDT
jgi:hypothetical protein